ncbi:MAG: nucleoside phosphorylase [Christensenellaceae bacterium]|jgi:uridine phosphorylase|nr:nucleoside phosphorylase [Christensenellaceae bacterium]
MKDIIPITEFFDDEPHLTPQKTRQHTVSRDDKPGRLKRLGINTAIITWLNDSDIEDLHLPDCDLFHLVLGLSGRLPVYIYKEKVLLVLMTVGAPNAAACVEELGYYGVKNFIAFGTAGCIDPNFDTSKLVIVERAIRDEGTSYHYLPPSVFVETDPEITNIIEKGLAKHNFSAVRGTAWTTDAFYRETYKRTSRRLEQGAIAVEMECAAFAAAAKRLGLRFGEFLFFSDAVANEGWKLIAVGDSDRVMKRELIKTALEMNAETQKLK